MRVTIRNLFKASGLFSCRHPTHKLFDYEVSPYHIFVARKCFPHGCVEFAWRCREFEKGRKCPRNFKHVGRKCFSCKQYHELKLSYAPETKLDDSALRDFIDDLREFEGWVESMNGRTIGFSGMIGSIKPHFKMKIESRHINVKMDGYYVAFDKGHIGNDLFDDRIYLRASERLITRTRIAPGDEMEFEGIFTHDRGRIILRSPRRMDITKNGGKQSLTPSRALVGRATGKIITGSIAHCNNCPYCSLVDIEDISRQKPSHYRRFYCLRGVTDSENCPVRLEKLLSPRSESRRSASRF